MVLLLELLLLSAHLMVMMVSVRNFARNKMAARVGRGTAQDRSIGRHAFAVACRGGPTRLQNRLVRPVARFIQIASRACLRISERHFRHSGSVDVRRMLLGLVGFVLFVQSCGSLVILRLGSILMALLRVEVVLTLLVLG